MRSEKEWESEMHIDTCGRDGSAEDERHHAYEPTPYEVLEELSNSGWIGRENVLVDYGCGKGRVGIFLSRKTGCKSLGIDYREELVREARRNGVHAGLGGRAEFFCADAQTWELPPEADSLYFFHPFPVKVLERALDRVLDSWYEAPRRMRLYFYYPSEAYIAALMQVEELSFLDEIDCSAYFPGDERERILIFETEDA